MTEDLRALLRAELEAERPPPIGDIVATAIREGKRRRSRRRFAAFGAGAALAGTVAVSAVVVAGLTGVERPPFAPAAAGPVSPPAPSATGSPGSVPTSASPSTPLTQARRFSISRGTERADAERKKATTAAMLHLLTDLLPPGQISHYGVASDDALYVQAFLDQGKGPGMVRARLSYEQPPADMSEPDTAVITVQHVPDDCVQNLSVTSAWSDGSVLQLDVANCVAVGPLDYRSAPPPLTQQQAVDIASDSRWGLAMDASIVDVGNRTFPHVPVFHR